MNKKGFTLVELLAIIVILSLIITIVATNGFGAFNNTKNKINETAKNEIKEGVNVFLTDIEHCDEKLNQDILDKFSINDDEVPHNGRCDDLQEKARGDIETSNNCLEFNLSDIIELGYVSSDAVIDIKEKGDFKIRACLNDGVKSIKIPCQNCI